MTYKLKWLAECPFTALSDKLERREESKMKKLVGISLLLVALPILLMVAPVQANCVPPGPTSLEVWKTICSVCYNPCTGMVTVTGYIHVQNDQVNTAYLAGITDMVEAKYKSGPWTQLGLVNVCMGDGMIAPGAQESYWFSITFEKGCWKAYRNVVTVWLENHPDGLHTFIYRLSFNVP
jgi:hypothetical protein